MLYLKVHKVHTVYAVYTVHLKIKKYYALTSLLKLLGNSLDE